MRFVVLTFLIIKELATLLGRPEEHIIEKLGTCRFAFYENFTNYLVSLSISALIRRTSGVNCVPLSRSAILMWNASLNPVLLVLCCNVNLFLQLDIFHLPVLC